MSPRNVLESQQSVHADLAGRSAAGCWKLAAGCALSLYPRQRSVLEIAQGRVWLTLSPASPSHIRQSAASAVVDQVLQAGERLTIEPGQHVVMEAWSQSGDRAHVGPVAFHWDLAPASAAAAALPASPFTRPFAQSSAASEWECGVVQPLRDLVHALGQGGRAVGTALADMAAAGGRFAAGLARFALHRIAAPLTRKPA
ncbi:MAG: DUF2917 domain-containing protein [Acidovorax sp.]|uniref:DUF2917 domain-containing protein n=1 Tax=Acidovorax sp. TaxID=1872122 RepID=UPI00391A78E1